MHANWSLLLNVILLVGVVIAIYRMIKERRSQYSLVASRENRSNAQVFSSQPPISDVLDLKHDDIISVRKINRDDGDTDTPTQIAGSKSVDVRPALRSSPQQDKPALVANKVSQPVMMFLSAQKDRQLAGYELLQTLLAEGLRFGEGQLFHRHQHQNGQGPLLFSLAAATPTGVFDLQNMGAFSVNGLCLFMHPSGNSTIDSERLTTMLDTAKHLSEGLGAHFLDDKQRPFSDASLRRYYQQLSIEPIPEQSAMA